MHVSFPSPVCSAIQLSLMEYQKEQKQSNSSGNPSMEPMDSPLTPTKLDSLKLASTTQAQPHSNGTVPTGVTIKSPSPSSPLPPKTQANGTVAKVIPTQAAVTVVPSSGSDEQLRRTIEQSRIEAEADAQLAQEEEEQLKKVLELSLQDK